MDDDDMDLPDEMEYSANDAIEAAVNRS